MTIKPRTFIKRIEPICFGYTLKQGDTLQWLKTAHARASVHQPENIDAFYDRIGKSCGIEQRKTCLSDYCHTGWEDMALYRSAAKGQIEERPWHAPTLERRIEIYRQVSERIGEIAYEDKTLSPAYLIKVSCTGYVSPNELQKIVEANHWEKKTRLLQLGHMGCYAAIPSINLASQLATVNSGQTVSILSTELCSLHLQPASVDMKQVVINSLFADGAVRVDVGDNCDSSGFEIIDQFECVIPGTAKEMSWVVADSAFRMTLTNGVPALLAANLPHLCAEFLEQNKLTRDDIALVAVHPGGPRIIDETAHCLELRREQVSHSREILRQRGNMSSATIPHIWHAMLEDRKVLPGTIILSIAFGPGLTLTANLLRKVGANGE